MALIRIRLFGSVFGSRLFLAVLQSIPDIQFRPDLPV